MTSKTRNRFRPKPSKCPKMLKIAKSEIKGAGLGLFIMENAKKGEFVARYSGEVMNRAENEARSSHYRIQISSNVYLDAEDSQHFEGRLINDGKRAGKGVNVRFSAGYRLNTCSDTNFKWIRIFATRNIRAGEELYLDYGEEFWLNHPAINAATTPMKPTPNSSSPMSLSPILCTNSQRTPPPMSGILILKPPSPWSPTISPPRIHGHHNPHPHSQQPNHIHTLTLNLNDPLFLNDHPKQHTPVWDNTIIFE